MDTPTVGRMVHYYPTGSDNGGDGPWSATVLAMDDTAPAIRVLRLDPPHAGPRRTCGVPYAATPTAGHWSWPPRVG